VFSASKEEELRIWSSLSEKLMAHSLTIVEKLNCSFRLNYSTYLKFEDISRFLLDPDIASMHLDVDYLLLRLIAVSGERDRLPIHQLLDIFKKNAFESVFN